MKIVIFSWLLFLPTIIFGQTGGIKGKVIYSTDSTGLIFTPVVLQGTKFNDLTDLDGNFQLDSLLVGTYNLIIIYDGILRDTIKSIKVTAGEYTTLSISVDPLICTRNPDQQCPIDGNTKEVIPFIRGMGNKRLQKKERKGKIRLTGCLWIGCPPSWYCKRHKHEY